MRNREGKERVKSRGRGEEAWKEGTKEGTRKTGKKMEGRKNIHRGELERMGKNRSE